MEALISAIETTPIIDHHAHNLLLPNEMLNKNFLSITSEANGDALQDTPSTLAHIRAIKQLAEILQCEPALRDVQRAINNRNFKLDDAWAKRCFEGIETVLVDDGLDADTVHSWGWHQRLTKSPWKRIVRIEKVAEEILINHMTDHRTDLREMMRTDQGWATLFSDWTAKYTKAVEKAIADPRVAGFKSVICYRTGLSIPKQEHFFRAINRPGYFAEFALFVLREPAIWNPVKSALKRMLGSGKAFTRLQDSDFSPFFVHLTADIISKSGKVKPLQFHTGLGDNEIRLPLSSPSHLQTFIEEYPKLPIVLLHASYPYTREAAYLASVYKNVYMDIGEVFPMISQEGQESVIRESLELCPSEKLTWSTDGHWFPETYLLAVLQIREGLKEVLQNSVKRRHLDVPQAIKIVQDILFNTSNKLYKLNLPLEPIVITPQDPGPTLPEPSHNAIVFRSHRQAKISDVSLFHIFLAANPQTQYLRVQWLDISATLRVRILPISQAVKAFDADKPLSITKACLGLLPNDLMTPGFSATGEYDLIPIFSSLRLYHRENYAVVQAEFRQKLGAEVPIDPRTALRHVNERGAARGVTFLLGFEIEVVFMNMNAAGIYEPITNSPGHGWASAHALRDTEIMGAIEEIHDTFKKADIELLMIHPESAPGQYEFILGALPPLEAVDTLVVAKDIIAAVGHKRGFRATCVPKPVPMACGTGAHVHVSCHPESHEVSFYAGILEHLPSIAAFTLSGEDSYKRTQDSIWAGGRWIAWGTQNRETPLRKIEGSHWELKCMDGLANPYLALAVILAAGLLGIEGQEHLRWKDCQEDPAKLKQSERLRLGIVEKLPKSLGEALEELSADEELMDVLGRELVEKYIALKRFEDEFLKSMDVEKRTAWLLERY